MKNVSRPHKGFTLVELALALTIVGLLLGGILKGQQILTNGKLTGTAAYANSVETAKETFFNTYGFLPGDLPDAHLKVPNCGAVCQNNLATGGDGIVGDRTWVIYRPMTPGPISGTISAATDEALLFWYELAAASLITGVNNEGVTGQPLRFGGSHPAAPIGGGFVLSNNTNNAAAGLLSGRNPASTYIFPGLVISLAPDPAAFLLPPALAGSKPGGGALTLPLTPAMAFTLDRKVDDGSPSSGRVQAYGESASCYFLVGGAATYDGRVGTRDCGVHFGI